MRVSDDVLFGPTEVYGRVVALERVYGTVSSYVRKGNRGPTLEMLIGQIESARQSGASESEICSKVRQGINNPPNTDQERVRQIKQLFLAGTD